ncbi:DUF1697 domain-containing protein [Homoserinibacter sp. GY 40078]|uniref:DUF1697 domain-containing protein n=1 Tax=Homoserinibacter sp. GY 40078 TaxID=2603275 RepID=UPI0011CB9978|nr:DUF1697 domain-containing protein [Homoserinibacter sp. GY 40078]TXK19692.1 DUF1697 domain-containing protein [Homoserinibacter sp. GY 40078]
MEYAVLLRGVNVGGVNLKMAELRELLEQRGYEGVRTVLASGNVLLDSAASASAVKDDVEAALRDRFGYPAWVHVLTIDALRAIIDAYPFERGRDGWHDYVLFVLDDDTRATLAATESDPDEGRIASGDGVIYWTVPKGDTLDSPFGKATAKAAYKPHLTNRNLNTLEKLVG